MTPEDAVKKLIAEIRADRKQRADDLKSFCTAIDAKFVEFKAERRELSEQISSLKFVLNDTREELRTARADIDERKAEIKMLSDFTGLTEKKVGNGHRGKR